MAFPNDLLLLDDFQRANENPIADPWASLSGTPNAQIFSNAWSVVGAFGQSYHKYFIARDQAVFATVGNYSAGTTLSLCVRMNGETADSTKFGYAVIANFDDTIHLDRVDAGGGGPTLGSVAQVISTGDKLGIQIIGPMIEVFYKPGAGAWETKLRIENNVYSKAGKVLLQAESTASIWDDLMVLNYDTSPNTASQYPKTTMRVGRRA